MRRIIRLDHLFTGLLSGLLVLLGFSACSEEIRGGDMYAPLTIDFEIKGKVIDKENKNAIPGIQVMGYPTYGDEEDKTNPKILETEEDGTYRILTNVETGTYRVIYEDIDGEENGGVYKKDTVDIDIFNPDKEVIRENGRYIVSFTQEMEKEDSENK